jgi:hypothetical protein
VGKRQTVNDPLTRRALRVGLSPFGGEAYGRFAAALHVSQASTFPIRGVLPCPDMSSKDVRGTHAGGIKVTLLCLATLAAGCGHPLKAGTKDAAPPFDGGLATFCTGEAPRMVVNGESLTPTTVEAYPIVMDCCDGGGVAVTSDALAFPIRVSWIVEASPTYSLPATIDLSSPPLGWHVEVNAGCDMTSAGCVATDSYQTGLVGWLTIARDPGRGIDMGVCVHVEEDTAEPASLLHSLDLYLPHAATS